MLADLAPIAILGPRQLTSGGRLNLVAAGNTYNACLHVLKVRGYSLWTEDLEGDRVLWCARRSNDTFAAYSPPELLGIVVLGEECGEAWKRDLPNVIREALDNDAPDGTS